MKNRKIEDIMADYMAAAAAASRDASTIPYNTRAAIQNAIRSAKDQLVELRKEYDDKLFSNAYAVVVEGDPAKVEQFKNVTTDIGGLVFDFDSVYEAIAGAVAPSIGFSREFGINQGFMVMQKLEQILWFNGIEFQIKDPNITTSTLVKTHEDLVQHVRNLLNQNFGHALTYLHVRANLLSRALAMGHAKKALAVTFVGGTTDDYAAVQPLFKNMSAVDVTDATVDQNYAISTFNKLNKKPKKADSHNENTKENENE